jgi:hypothetical protein
MGKKLDTPTQENYIFQCWIEEYKTLRSEIEQRQISIRFLVILNITAIGTILSVVFTKTEAYLSLLLIIPIFAGLIGMLTFIHSRKISQLAHYIRFVIKPSLVTITDDEGVINWEFWVRSVEEKKNLMFRWFFHTGGISLFSYFLPSVLACVFVAEEVFKKGGGWVVFWFFDILFVFALGYCLYSDRNYWFKKTLNDVMHSN